MSQSEDFYQKLNSRPRQIRLLTIEPGKWTRAIQCTLRQTSLSSAGQYETLSYAWGDPAVTKTIIVDKKPFQVTVNLASALRHLRRDTPRTMWIDAICINQMDLEERASQVSFMRDIYQRSVSTVIWLGEGDERVKLPFRLARIFRLRKREDRPWHPRNIFRLHKMIGSEYCYRSLEFLTTEVLMRPWWTRAWVLQEAVVSKCPIVKFGHQEIEWYYLWWLASGLVGGLNSPFLSAPEFAGTLKEVLKIQKMRDALEQKRQILLAQLVAWNRRQRSTDARDKIFSLLGLVSDTPVYCLRPNYSASNKLVNVCLGLVEQSIGEGSLNIICMCQGSEKPNWPSWVPDWDVHSSQNAEIAYPLISSLADQGRTDIAGWNNGPLSSDYDASRSLAPKYNLLRSPLALRVAGVCVDTIHRLAETDHPDKRKQWCSKRPDPWENLLLSYFRCPSIIRQVSNWRYVGKERRPWESRVLLYAKETYYDVRTYVNRDEEFILEWSRLMHEVKRSGYECGYVSGGSFANAYFRTLITDVVFTGNRRKGVFDPLYADLQAGSAVGRGDKNTGFEDTGDCLNGDVGRSYVFAITCASTIKQAISYRRLMISSKRYIGLVPAKAQEGDLICVLFGCSVPVILRKQGDNYTFIGESYVHGIMDGEAIEMMHEGSLVEEEFTLI
ncbi:hypothetical protein ASPTUDRAFT_118842 [Aspergillus tubingensis CBS 134.48]|uniref:Heterokaryon incompatibility domain-containing protein n=1 Tax=Aspergillus tubingensis (strain CBS 134.48) TaxID=767770 RepID=A0A1L9N983_ASPTC|nr:hypothetical protein ASPTUDRAFT_118842 [Aspergillus tubingensis CBS 134.48]